MDVINEFSTAITEKSDGLPDQVIAEIELMKQQPQQLNDVSVFGSFSVHHSRCDTSYLEGLVAEFGSDIPELDSDLGLHSVTNNSNCDTRLPDINLNRLADEVFTLKIQTKQQQEMILELKKQVKTLTDIFRENSWTMLGERLHQSQVEQEGMAQHATCRRQLEIDENNTVTEKGRSTQSDSSGGMEQLRETETVQSPATEKCNGSDVLNNRSNNDAEHHDESEEIMFSVSNRMNTQTFLGDEQQLHQIQVEQERIFDNVTMNGQFSEEECNEKSVLYDVQQNNDMEEKDRSASSHQENNCVQSEGTSPIKQLRSVRNRKGGSRKITITSGDTDAPSKASRVPRKHTKTHSCTECNKRFISQSQLIRHLRVHNGEKPYKCTDCNAAFNQLSNLKVHQWIHAGEKPHKCKECNAAFSNASNLKKHQTVHSGEKPYKCKECNVAFSQGSSLKRHQRTTHSGDTAFSCDICKKSFKHKQYLSSHMDIHGGIKSHKCTICEKEFRQRGNLWTHLKIHSKQNPTRL